MDVLNENTPMEDSYEVNPSTNNSNRSVSIRRSALFLSAPKIKVANESPVFLSCFVRVVLSCINNDWRDETMNRIVY